MRSFLLIFAALLTSIVACSDGVADPQPASLARVIVTTAPTSTRAGDTIRFMAHGIDTRGDTTIPALTWKSSDTAVAAIDSTGALVGLRRGRTLVTAVAAGVESDPVEVTVLERSRAGAFVGELGGTTEVSGRAILDGDVDGMLTVTLDSAFTSSDGPDLHVFLSTTERIGATSLKLGRLRSLTGHQTYAVPAGVERTTYDWVVIHCVLHNHTYGYARLQ